MIKPTVNETKKRKKLPFPKFMVMEHARVETLKDMVVMFHEEGKGFIVYSSSTNWVPGEYFTDWVMSSFEDFHGSVTLKQE